MYSENYYDNFLEKLTGGDKLIMYILKCSHLLFKIIIESLLEIVTGSDKLITYILINNFRYNMECYLNKTLISG